MPAADLHRIRFITNREDLGAGAAMRFGGWLGAGLSAGVATVRLSDGEAPNIQIFDSKPGRVSDVQVFGAAPRGAPCGAFVAALAADLPARRDVMLFAHGFDTNFDQALCYAAQIEVQLRKRLAALRGQPHLPSVPEDIAVVAVTWPSDGGALNYFLDRRDAGASGPPFGAAVEAIRACRALPGAAARRVHLHCQSMGARVLAYTLAELRRTPSASNGARLFDVASFSGADVGEDALVDPDELAGLDALSGQINVYHNGRDVLGLLSRFLLFRKPMSRYGAQVPPGVSNVDVLDVSPCIEKRRDKYGHYYARINKHVQTDWALSLCGASRTARATRSGLVDHAPYYEIVPGSGVGVD